VLNARILLKFDEKEKQEKLQLEVKGVGTILLLS